MTAFSRVSSPLSRMSRPLQFVPETSVAPPVSNNSFLLLDGTSGYLLLEDGVSKLILE